MSPSRSTSPVDDDIERLEAQLRRAREKKAAEQRRKAEEERREAERVREAERIERMERERVLERKRKEAREALERAKRYREEHGSGDSDESTEEVRSPKRVRVSIESISFEFGFDVSLVKLSWSFNSYPFSSESFELRSMSTLREP